MQPSNEYLMCLMLLMLHLMAHLMLHVGTEHAVKHQVISFSLTTIDIRGTE